MSRTDLEGTELDGRYRLESLLGDGGMGQVFRATQLSLERTVAVKLLREEVSTDDQMRQRFDREAKILSGLDHPGIVRVHDYGVHEGCPYLVMDLVQGRTLEAHLRERGQLAPAEVKAILVQICDALSHAHEAGIVHRDLKPENIVLEEGGRVRILDFGIARMVIGDDAQSQPELTSAGMMVGTPQYVSPEQATGKPIDGRTDLYSLGLIAYRMLAGRPPFRKQSAGEYLVAHVTETPPTLEELGVDSAGLSLLVRRAMEKEPGARFASAAELQAALEGLGELPTSLRSREDAPAATGELPAAGSTRPMFQAGEQKFQTAPTVASQQQPVAPAATTPDAPAPLAAAASASASAAPAPAPGRDRWPLRQVIPIAAGGALVFVLGLGLALTLGGGEPAAVAESNTLLAAGKIPAARQRLEEAIAAESEPEAVARLRATLGRALVAAEAPLPALEQFRLAIGFDPDALADEDLAALAALLERRGPASDQAETLLLRLEGRAGDHLKDLSEDERQPLALRLRAAALAERLGESLDRVPLLIEALEAEACEVRRTAIKELGTLGDARALEPLQAYVAERGDGLLARFACGQAAAQSAIEQIQAAGD
ncbi:MAG: serine/threonine-protein kinase [Deltaproteobacteria bacterium]|nr:serine/threonine-protein kinase [Deltaproteobacteria bacterium]